MTILSDLLGVIRERQLINETVNEHSRQILCLQAETELLLMNEEKIMKYFEADIEASLVREKRVKAVKSLLDELLEVDLGRIEEVLEVERLRLEVLRRAEEGKL